MVISPNGMDIKKYIVKNLIQLKVIPNSQQNKLMENDGSLKLYLAAPPDQGKANRELISFFKKEFGLKVRIKWGTRNREKILEII